MARKQNSKSDEKERSENVILHFGVKPHEIDARTLLESFGALEAALTAIAKHGHPQVQLRIKVKPFQDGSFEVPIEIQQTLLVGALALSSIDWATAKESVKILIDLVKLSVALKGKKPKAVESDGKTVKVFKNRDSSIYVDQRTYNIHLKDVTVTESIAKSFQALDADPEVKSFTVLDEKRAKLLQVPRRSFGHVSKQIVEKADSEQRTTERAVLPIFKAVFDAGYKWEFYFRGIKIPATIADLNFLHRVKNGERFGRGDTLDVDLEILKKFDEGVQTFINKSYKILLVHRIQRRPEQMDLPQNV